MVVTVSFPRLVVHTSAREALAMVDSSVLYAASGFYRAIWPSEKCAI